MSDAQSSKKKPARGLFREIVSTVVYPLLTVLAIYSFIIQPFRIPSGSMLDTLLIGDFVWVEKFAYGYSKHSIPFSPNLFSGRIWSAEPTRGDVIVFKWPQDTSLDFIKRLVGLPGDRIQMKDGLLYINGAEVKRDLQQDLEFDYYDPGEGHLPAGIRHFHGKKYLETLPNGVQHAILTTDDSHNGDDTSEFTVPPNCYFMMGDNRNNSDDSRFWGCVPAENLEGKAVLIFPSFDGGKSEWWQIWNWPFAIRWDRLFHGIN